jgi:hypothetical protein
VIDEVVGHTAAWSLERTSWRISDATVPTDLERELYRRGGVVEERFDVLALPIADGLPDFGVPPDVAVREVTDESTLRDAYVVSDDAFGGQTVTDERIATDLEELGTGSAEGRVGRVDTSAPILHGLGFTRYGEQRVVRLDVLGG